MKYYPLLTGSSGIQACTELLQDVIAYWMHTKFKIMLRHQQNTEKHISNQQDNLSAQQCFRREILVLVRGWKSRLWKGCLKKKEPFDHHW